MYVYIHILHLYNTFLKHWFNYLTVYTITRRTTVLMTNSAHVSLLQTFSLLATTMKQYQEKAKKGVELDE